MSKFEYYSDEKYENLQKRIALDVRLTQDNVKSKVLELPILYTKYKKLFIDQSTILENMNIELQKVKAKRYHYYKFDGDFRLDSATEINMYVNGDDEVCNYNLMIKKQTRVVESLKGALETITKMSYLIKAHIDLEKLRNGEISA